LHRRERRIIDQALFRSYTHSTVTASTVSARPRSSRFGYLSELWARREFIWYSALADMRAKHANTVFGIGWWVLSPLLLGSVYLLVFGYILETRRGDPNYIGFLLAGLFAFTYSRELMTRGPQSIRTNGSIIAARRFPRLILPLTAVMQSAVGFAASLVPFVLIAGLTNGDWPGMHTFIIIPIFILQTLFNIGLATIFAQLIVPFPDVGNAMQFVGRIWLYTSPVIFPIEVRLKALNEAAFTAITIFNPMVSILGVWRGALLNRPIEDWMWYGAIGWSLLVFTVGVLTFVRNEDRLVRHVL
jgi:teichoic acid transport system permease protein